VCDLTGNSWAITIVKKGVKKIVRRTRKTFSLFTTKDSYTRNITHAVRKYCSVELEAGVVWITVGSTKVPGRTGLYNET